MWNLQREVCRENITGSGSHPFVNTWAELQVKGDDNSNCWKATNTIISNCLNTNHGKYKGSGTWCANEQCTESYSVWINSVYKSGCWNGRDCKPQGNDCITPEGPPGL
jgi:hypothetical protein